MTAVRTSLLYNKRGSSDKFYLTEIIRTTTNKFFILAYYGRRPQVGGLPPHITFKLKSTVPFSDLAAAENSFNNLVTNKSRYNFYTEVVPPKTDDAVIYKCVAELRSNFLQRRGLELGGKLKSKQEKIMENVFLKGEEHRKLQIF